MGSVLNGIALKWVWALLYNQPLFDRKGAIVHGEIDLATARIGEIPEDEEGEGAE